MNCMSKEFFDEKEGRAHMVRGWDATKRPTGEPNRELLKRVLGGGLALFNPYHDPVGKFTDKMHAAAPLPEKKMKIDDGVNRKAAFRLADATALAYERMEQEPGTLRVFRDNKEYAAEVCAGSLTCSAVIGKTYGAHINNTIYIGPRGTKAMARDRKFGEYVVQHEAMHSRVRSDGSHGSDLSFDRSIKGSFEGAHARKTCEEGLTDLLARRLCGVNHKYWLGGGSGAYMPNMGAIAILVGQASNWNKSVAWQMIDQLHAHINDPGYWNEFLSSIVKPRAGSYEDGNNYFALMKTMQRRAEWGNYEALAWLFRGGK
jgi:hypothetical protein